MKKLNLLIFMLLPFLIFSQHIVWDKSYGSIHADYLFDAKPTADYRFILTGSSISEKIENKTRVNHGDLVYSIWKMKEKCELGWQKSIGENDIKSRDAPVNLSGYAERIHIIKIQTDVKTESVKVIKTVKLKNYHNV